MASSDVNRGDKLDWAEADQNELQGQSGGINSAANWASGFAVVLCITGFVSVALFLSDSHVWSASHRGQSPNPPVPVSPEKAARPHH